MAALLGSISRGAPLWLQPNLSVIKSKSVTCVRIIISAGNTAIIIDLSDDKSVLEGVALAKAGYRPVPLYNGVYIANEKSMVVNVGGIVSALFRTAPLLSSLPIKYDAPPVFLLHSKRLSASSKPGQYDNRWSVFPQDMPSGAFLMEQGIKRVYLRIDAGRVQNDLLHILRRYYEKGIGVYLCGPDRITFRMCKLSLNPITVKSKLIQQS